MVRLVAAIVLALASVAGAQQNAFWGAIQGKTALRCNGSSCQIPGSMLPPGPTPTTTPVPTTSSTSRTTTTSSSTVPPAAGGATVAPFLVQTAPAGASEVAYGFQQIFGTGRNMETYISQTGRLVVDLQAAPMNRNAEVQAGLRVQPGGFPLCNGDTYVVKVAGRLGGVPSLDMPWTRRPTSKVRGGQLVYAGYGGSDAIGHAYRAQAGCETGRASTLTWPTAPGATITDGSCVFREQPLQPVQFTDGTAVIAFTWGADAYCGAPGFEVGTDSLNEPFLRSSSNDNHGGLFVADYPNMSGPPYYDSSHLLLWAVSEGDMRSGLSGNVENAQWNPWVHEISGGATYLGNGQFSGAPALTEPKAPPIVELAPGTASLTKPSYCFVHSWEDERWQGITGTSRIEECVPTPPPGNCLEVSIPATEWPVGSDNASGQAGVRAWVFSGDETLRVYIGSVERPKGIPGAGNDRLRICSDDFFKELQTAEAYNRATRSVVSMGDPALMPPKFRPGGQVIPGLTMITPTVEDGHAYIDEGVNCSADCSDCQRGLSPRGTMGTVEPVWSPATNPFHLIFENGNCWKRLGILGHALALTGPLRFYNPGTRGALPKAVGELGYDAAGNFQIEILNQTCPNPLDAVSCPPLKTFSKDGVKP